MAPDGFFFRWPPAELYDDNTWGPAPAQTGSNGATLTTATAPEKATSYCRTSIRFPSPVNLLATNLLSYD